MNTENTKEHCKQQYIAQCKEEVEALNKRHTFLHNIFAFNLGLEIFIVIALLIGVCAKSTTTTTERVYEYGRWVTKTVGEVNTVAILIAFGTAAVIILGLVVFYNLIMHFIYAASYTSKNSICQMYKLFIDNNELDTEPDTDIKSEDHQLSILEVMDAENKE